jgi:uncharacterized protein YkwD
MARIGKSLLVLVAALAFAVPAAVAGRTAERRTAMQALDAGVLARLNAIRTAHGLVPLTLNRQLSAAAAGHTAEMLADGYFAHDSESGSPFWSRLTAYTKAAPHGGWSVGENLLWSAPDVDAIQALKLWMASPEHRANILTAKWRQIGIAAIHANTAPGAFGNQTVTVITTDFGVRS